MTTVDIVMNVARQFNYCPDNSDLDRLCILVTDAEWADLCEFHQVKAGDGIRMMTVMGTKVIRLSSVRE